MARGVMLGYLRAFGCFFALGKFLTRRQLASDECERPTTRPVANSKSIFCLVGL